MADGSSHKVDENYLRESMMDPAAKVVKGFAPSMPTYQGKLAGPETAAIVEYIKSLSTANVRNGPSEGPSYEPIRVQ